MEITLIVYDNSLIAASDSGSHAPWRVEYIHDPTNPGVSTAYNKGFSLGKRRNKRWILLLDQDTWFPPDALTAYARAVAAFPTAALFAPMLVSESGALLSPSAYRFKRGFPLANPERLHPGQQKLWRRTLLNSGLLISLEAFERAGGYNPRIRLDFADVDFIERFQELFQEYVLLDVRCTQRFSGERVDLEAARRRFAFYCEGARQLIGSVVDALVLALIVLARCLRLSLRYRTMRFIGVYGRHFVLGQLV